MTQNTFWKDRERWPTDPPDWLFLGRAANYLGEKMFEDWGECGFAEFDSLAAMVSLLDKPPPRQNALAEKAGGGKLLVDPLKSEAFKLDMRKRLAVLGGQIHEVQEQIRRWAEGAPFLLTGSRNKGGGPVQVLQPDAWSTQHLGVRFYCCQIDRSEPFGRHFASERSQHIFVKRDQFFALVRLNIEDAPEEGDRLLAGYDRLAPSPAAVTFVEAEQPAQVAEVDRGGKPLEAEKWSNLVGVMAAALHHQDLKPGLKKGQLYQQLEAYADLIGATIPSRTTAIPAMAKALKWVDAPHDSNGRPEQDKDGNPIT